MPITVRGENWRTQPKPFAQAAGLTGKGKIRSVDRGCIILSSEGTYQTWKGVAAASVGALC